jgi:hypothetical protein
MVRYATECFSGECGLCHGCSSPMAGEKLPDTTPECLKRGKDTSIFNETRIKGDYTLYFKLLHGVKRVNTKIEDKYGKKYKKIEGYHGAICDDPICKSFYVSSGDDIHTLIYPEIPMYTRVSSGNDNDMCQLCVLCVNNKQPWS